MPLPVLVRLRVDPAAPPLPSTPLKVAEPLALPTVRLDAMFPTLGCPWTVPLPDRESMVSSLLPLARLRIPLTVTAEESGIRLTAVAVASLNWRVEPTLTVVVPT